MTKLRRAPKKVYDKLSKYFPVSTVDTVIFDNDSFLLTKRTIRPYKGLWHLPGGLIRKGETLESASKRTVKNELALDIKLVKFLGVYENPVRTRHDISHCFVAKVVKGKIKSDFQSSSVRFFKMVPQNTIPYQKKMIRDAVTLIKIEF